MRRTLLLFAALVACSPDTFSSDDGGGTDAGPTDSAPNSDVIVSGDAGDGAAPAAWQQVSSFPGSGETLHGVWGRTANDVYVVGEAGNLYKWDGNWTQTGTGTSRLLFGVAGDAIHEYIVGQGGFEDVVSLGNHTVSSDGAGQPLYGVAVDGSGTGTVWGVGLNNAVVAYNGTSWQNHSAQFGSDRTCYAVSNDLAACAGGYVRNVSSAQDIDTLAGSDLLGIWAGAAGVVAVGKNGSVAAMDPSSSWSHWEAGTGDLTAVVWEQGRIYATGIDGNVYEGALDLTTTLAFGGFQGTKIGSGAALRGIAVTGDVSNRWVWVVGDAGTVYRKHL